MLRHLTLSLCVAVAALTTIGSVAALATPEYGKLAGSEFLKQPRGMAEWHTPDGVRPLVADSELHKIFAFDPAAKPGTPPTEILGTGVPSKQPDNCGENLAKLSLTSPRNVAVDNSGKILVADEWKVCSFDPRTKQVSTIMRVGEGVLKPNYVLPGAPPGLITAMAVNRHDDLLVAYQESKWSSATLVRHRLGAPPATIKNTMRTGRVRQISPQNDGKFLISAKETQGEVLIEVNPTDLHATTIDEYEWTGGQTPRGNFIFMIGANKMYHLSSPLRDAVARKKAHQHPGKFLVDIQTGVADKDPLVYPVTEDIAFVTFDRANEVYYVFNPADIPAKAAGQKDVSSLRDLAARKVVELSKKQKLPNADVAEKITSGAGQSLPYPAEIRELLNALHAEDSWDTFRAKLLVAQLTKAIGSNQS